MNEETARYLASYLIDNQTSFLHTWFLNGLSGAELDQEKLKSLILEFFKELL